VFSTRRQAMKEGSALAQNEKKEYIYGKIYLNLPEELHSFLIEKKKKTGLKIPNLVKMILANEMEKERISCPQPK